MNSLNSIIIEGTILQNSEVKAVLNDSALDFDIAFQRFFKVNGEPKEKTFKVNVRCYGQMAQMLSSRCKKGQGIRIVGRLESESWFDGDDLERFSTYVVAEHIEFRKMPKIKEEVQKDEETEVHF